MAVRTGLDMSSEYRRPALHDGACGFADVGGERVRLLVGWKRVLEDGLERDKRHRCLRLRRVVWDQCFVPDSIAPAIPATSG